MANEENLIPFNERSVSETRALGRKGGIASGKARREKADLKKKVNHILEMDVFSPRLKEALEEKGLNATNQKEQKERIKAQQLENQKKAQQLEGNVVSEDIMSDYFDKLEGVVKDGS